MPQNNQTLSMSVSEVVKGMTLKVVVTGYRSWFVRLKIASFLIRLAAKVAGMGIEIVNKDENKEA